MTTSSYPNSGIVRFESLMKDTYDPTRIYTGVNAETCKPNGLWLSTIRTTTNWRTWLNENCDDKKEDTKDDTNYEQFDVSLDGILVIDSLVKLIDFTNKYKNHFADNFSTNVIRWNSVIKDYDGIFIHNIDRQDLFRTENFKSLIWYTTYDCDTLVVWNLSCVKYVECVACVDKKYNDDCWIA